MAVHSLRDIWRHNLETIRRQPLAEISGSLGDLGIFLPILIALAEIGQISLSTTLVFTGAYNILTGAVFGIPLPVQPMKAIAAVAILKALSAGEVAAAGIFVAACILLLSVTGLLHWFTLVIPIPVVKGIQVGAGLSLVIAAGSKVLAELAWTGPSWADNYLWVLVAFFALMLLQPWSRIPYALIVTLLGILLAIVRLFDTAEFPHFRAWRPYILVPHNREWKSGTLDAGIGQLPLTTLNSVIAVVHLAADLLPDKDTTTVTSIGLSVAAMNLLGVWFGVMPVCHGSGGLAAQYRFGARSGASIIFLGFLKLLIGLFFGESLAGLLYKFPTALLTVMVIAAGLELAGVGESLNTDRARDLGKRGIARGTEVEAERKKRWMVMLVTVGILVGFRNDAIGFLAGMLCHWGYRLSNCVSSLRNQVERARARRQEDGEESLLPE